MRREEVLEPRTCLMVAMMEFDLMESDGIGWDRSGIAIIRYLLLRMHCVGLVWGLAGVLGLVVLVLDHGWVMLMLL